MSSLLVFIGKPAVGKSTLISVALSTHVHVDVMPFVTKYENKPGNSVSHEHTLLGYNDMYKHLDKELKSSRPIVLELGTNHSDLNVTHLKHLSLKHEVTIFLCTASIETSRKRAIERNNNMNQKALEERLSRDFPNSHTPLFANASLDFIILDMEKPLADNIKELQKHI
ncbi:MAG TPA: GTPase [Candidatus Paceibacterota bacterium]|nr:GTPase [Candidatus Paceibacterota bacterium]